MYIVILKIPRYKEVNKKEGVSMEKVTRDTKIGEILAMGPEAQQVMNKVFGPGCFGCVNSKTKTLEFGAKMHGHDPEQVAKELNEVLTTAHK